MVDLSPEQIEQLNEVLSKLPEEEREDKKQEILSQMESPQCPFCMMTSGQIKTTNVYEDEKFLAVLEINPANPGHILLFPKKHVTTLSELSDEEQEQFFIAARKLNYSVLKFSEGSSLVMSSGKVTGVKFPHLMFNIMPRVSGDEVFLTWKPKKVSPDDLEAMRKLIQNNFPAKKVEEKPAEKLNPEALKASFDRLTKRKG